MNYEYLNSSGVIVPDTADTKEEIIKEYKEVFGQDIYTADYTPQGLLINAETLTRQNIARNNAAVANQINPNIASGIFLDAIWALTGGQRLKATKTIVYNVALAGVPSTIIPEGTIVQSGNNQFESLSRTVLDASGNATATFQALIAGSISCAVNTLTQIITPVLGLESVNNPIDGITGKDQESDQAARKRRKNTLALQGSGTLEAITSNVYNTEGVKSLKALENVTDAQAIILGVTLKPHSIWLCVDGGSDQDVAEAIFVKKDPGSGFNGSTKVEILSGSNPVPYKVFFDRPKNILVYVKVTISKNNTTNEADKNIKNAIVQYADGDFDSEDGLGVGVNVSPFELSGAINQLSPEIFVKKVELSLDNVVYSMDEIDIAIYELAIITETMIFIERV